MDLYISNIYMLMKTLITTPTIAITTNHPHKYLNLKLLGSTCLTVIKFASDDCTLSRALQDEQIV